MVAGVVLTVLVQDVVARAHHDGGSELERSAPCVVLSMPAGERPEPGGELPRAEQRCRTERPGSDDLGGRPVLVEQDRERDPLVLDERLCVASTAGADGGDAGTRGGDLVVSISDLTGPLTARQSAEVAQEEQDLGTVAPEVAKAMLSSAGIDEHDIGKLGCVEWHPCLVVRLRDGRSTPGAAGRPDQASGTSNTRTGSSKPLSAMGPRSRNDRGLPTESSRTAPETRI